MANENVNHVVINGETKLDLRSDTVTAQSLLRGYTAHDASGSSIVGVASENGGITQDQDGYLVLDDSGDGGSVSVQALNVTENGTYTAPTGAAYSPVTVNVSGGALTAEISGTIEATTTSTTPTVVATLTYEHQSSWIKFGSYLLVCVVHDTNLGRNNYFQHSTSVNMYPASNMRTWVFSRNSSGNGVATGVAYGVYLSSWSDTHDGASETYTATYTFSARTHSTYAPTVDSEYAYKIYVVPMSDLM